MYRLDEKLARILDGKYTRRDFVIADAKDPDMGGGVGAYGPKLEADGTSQRFRTRAEFLEQITAIVEQDVVDIMLTSASNLEILVGRGVFQGSRVKPAFRANDTTCVWPIRGAVYTKHPSRPFRTASIPQVMYGRAAPAPGAPVYLTDLGLYSMTFNNNFEADIASLDAFAKFRDDATANGLTYFLEVFNPNVDTGIAPDLLPHYINDCIVRALAGVVKAQRPRFLKIAYNGPKALEELASHDATLIVGLLGGSAGTTRDTFELLHQGEKYGARIALFGRKINLAESPLAIVRLMRDVVDGSVSPRKASRPIMANCRRPGSSPSARWPRTMSLPRPC